MTIFDEDWNKAKIIRTFGTLDKLHEVSTHAWHSSNGEYKFTGTWYHYHDLQELIRIYNTSDDDVEDSNLFKCWSCDNMITEIARMENDGFCPLCQAEIELD